MAVARLHDGALPAAVLAILRLHILAAPLFFASIAVVGPKLAVALPEAPAALPSLPLKKATRVLKETRHQESDTEVVEEAEETRDESGKGKSGSGRGRRKQKPESETHESRENEEAGGAKEEEKEEEVSVFDWTIATMMFGFFTVNISLLYLTNYKDADIRMQIFKMDVSVTISIWCAVMLNLAILAFLFGNPHRFGLDEFSSTFKIICCTSIYMIWAALLNYLCWMYRLRKATLYCTRMILGHLMAFAAINGFSELQHEEWFCHISWRIVLVCFLCWLAFLIIRAFSFEIRDRYFLEGGYDAENIPHWVEAVVEAENEATQLATTCLLCQYACFVAQGELPTLDSAKIHPTHTQVMCLAKLIGVCFLFLLVTTLFNSNILPKVTRKGGVVQRIACNVHGGIVVMMSWLLFRCADWEMQMATQHWRVLS
jgi:hypothetical protein